MLIGAVAAMGMGLAPNPDWPETSDRMPHAVSGQVFSAKAPTTGFDPLTLAATGLGSVCCICAMATGCLDEAPDSDFSRLDRNGDDPLVFAFVSQPPDAPPRT